MVDMLTDRNKVLEDDSFRLREKVVELEEARRQDEANYRAEVADLKQQVEDARNVAAASAIAYAAETQSGAILLSATDAEKQSPAAIRLAGAAQDGRLDAVRGSLGGRARSTPRCLERAAECVGDSALGEMHRSELRPSPITAPRNTTSEEASSRRALTPDRNHRPAALIRDASPSGRRPRANSQAAHDIDATAMSSNWISGNPAELGVVGLKQQRQEALVPELAVAADSLVQEQGVDRHVSAPALINWMTAHHRASPRRGEAASDVAADGPGARAARGPSCAGSSSAGQALEPNSADKVDMQMSAPALIHWAVASERRVLAGAGPPIAIEGYPVKMR
jgi:hypothetical protein